MVLFSNYAQDFKVGRIMFEGPTSMPPVVKTSASTVGGRDSLCDTTKWAVALSTPDVGSSASPLVKSLSPEFCLVIVGAANADSNEWEAFEKAHNMSVSYLSQDRQATLNNSILEHLSSNHFLARKNVGYLYAIQQGGVQIFDLDLDAQFRLKMHFRSSRR